MNLCFRLELAKQHFKHTRRNVLIWKKICFPQIMNTSNCVVKGSVGGGGGLLLETDQFHLHFGAVIN